MYEISIPSFEGPLDLLLHLVKQSNVNINEISITDITKQYMAYINKMEEMNLNIASEYLVMATELMEIKSSSLLPKIENNNEEEDPKEQLIKRLLEYEQYKNLTNTFKELESLRQEVYTRKPNNLLEFKEKDVVIDYEIDLNSLLEIFSKFLEKKELNKPLNTKIATKEYSVSKRSIEIKNLLRKKHQVYFTDLFETFTKDYIVVTFLSILSMTRKQEIEIEQKDNFKNIIIKEKVINHEQV